MAAEEAKARSAACARAGQRNKCEKCGSEVLLVTKASKGTLKCRGEEMSPK